jgi:hypothetical protein
MTAGLNFRDNFSPIRRLHCTTIKQASSNFKRLPFRRRRGELLAPDYRKVYYSFCKFITGKGTARRAELHGRGVSSPAGAGKT